MRKHFLFFLGIFVPILLFSLILPLHAFAGQAGVGVINVPPKYGYIRIEEQEDFIRVYLNISDYNSWADISNVSVIIDNYGAKISTFLFQQYKSIDSYVEINEFSETPKNNHLLDLKKCFFQKSNNKETIDERCDIAIRFVFRKTFFTGLTMIINDRAGSSPAEAYISYNTEETMRSGNTIIIPWVGLRFTLDLPPYLLDLIACALGITGVVYYLKKTGLLGRRGVSFEKTTE